MHGQEIMRDPAFGDEAQFLFRPARALCADVPADSVTLARFRQIAQMLVGGLARRHRFVRDNYI